MGNRLSAPTPTMREAAGGPGDSASSITVTTTKEIATQRESEVSQLEEKEGKDPDFDQCGLDPDPEGLWEDDDPPSRIKESRLTEEEKTKFRGLLAKIFHPDAIKGIRVEFTPKEVTEVCDKVIPYLASEPMLIEDVPFDITIVADLHGQLYDLNRVFKGDEKDGKPGWECQKYLFLGDYVDRGRQSLEIVMALYCIKMLYPDRIFLLRGNHEYVTTNARHGFILDFVDRYEDEDEKGSKKSGKDKKKFGKDRKKRVKKDRPLTTCDILYFKVNESFCWLSAAAIVGFFAGNSYFCAHAGISPAAFTRRHLLAINKPLFDSRKDLLIHDLHWSDVAKGLTGTTFNGTRGTSIFFGLDELALALHNMECTGLFRGHIIMENGFEVIGGLCVSLFTATGTSNFNHGAVAVLDGEGKLTMRVLECSPERVAWVNRLKRWDGDCTSDDEITVDTDDDSGDGKTPNFKNK